jgi:hypothetical protein
VSQFEVRYAHRWRGREVIDADDVFTEERWLVFTAQVLVIGRLRPVVQLRVPLAEVADVIALPDVH